MIMTEDSRKKIESDMLALMGDFRNNANLKDPPGMWTAKLREILDRQEGLTLKECAEQLERDYVRRDAVENHPEWIANLKCSEWMEKAHKLERERDELRGSVDTARQLIEQYKDDGIEHLRKIDLLTAERDEWKARAEGLSDRIPAQQMADALIDFNSKLPKLDHEVADMVNHPPHYTNGDIECIDAIQAALTPEEFRGYCKGNVIKYTWREDDKGGLQDLLKAVWYLNKVVSVYGSRV